MCCTRSGSPGHSHSWRACGCRRGPVPGAACERSQPERSERPAVVGDDRSPGGHPGRWEGQLVAGEERLQSPARRARRRLLPGTVRQRVRVGAGGIGEQQSDFTDQSGGPDRAVRRGDVGDETVEPVGYLGQFAGPQRQRRGGVPLWSMSSRCRVSGLVVGAVSVHGVDDVDAASREADEGRVVLHSLGWPSSGRSRPWIRCR